jgi:glycine/D-amino acid oxidase-like deaminating enzyme
VFARLFPDAKVKILMNSTHVAGNHIRIKIPNQEEHRVEKSVIVYYNNVTSDGRSFDVTSFTNGDLYIGGWGAIPEEIPDLATSVHAQPSKIEEMIPWVKKYVNMNTEEELDYFDEGRCYRPTVIGHNRPIIAKVGIDLLGKYTRLNTMSLSEDAETPSVPGGVIINTGHGRRRVAQALGSGKVASELVLGLTPSADISTLGLPESARL